MATKRVSLKMATLTMILLLEATCANKEGIKDIANGISQIAILAGVPGNPVSTGALVAQAVTFIVIGILEKLATAPTNPDASFTTVATVTPVQFFIPTSPESLPNGLNESFAAAGRLVDDSRLLDFSLKKYYGAIAANDAVSMQLQKGAACHSLSELNADLQAYSAALTQLSASAQGTPFATASTTVPQVLQLRDQIVQSGSFPASEAFVFTQANASSQEVSQALGQVATVTGTTLTDSDLTGSVIFDRAASAISGANASAFLPSGFACNTEQPITATLTVSGSFAVGSTATYTLVLLNSGTFAMPDNPGDELADALPLGLTLVNASATSGIATATVGTNTAAWNGSIPAGGSVIITINATIQADAHGTIANQASFSYDADLNGSNESSGVSDDPTALGSGNPTSFLVPTLSVIEVPALSALGLWVLGLSLLGVCWIRLGRRRTI